jgi:hypothetical protein
MMRSVQNWIRTSGMLETGIATLPHSAQAGKISVNFATRLETCAGHSV